MAENRLLNINGLRTHFYTNDGIVKAIDGITFSVEEGEVVAIVGESGCGKSVTALSILRLIPDPPGRIVGGQVNFKNHNLLDLSEEEMREIRGNEISMIFQEPMTSLNPVFKIGDQIAETIQLHQNLKRKDALEKTVEMLRLVKIPSPQKRINEYPHQISGGMKQRVMIAMALSCNPKMLIADEPTTALDVTIQAQILDLIYNTKDQFNTAVLLITHDLGVVAEIASKVIVMYTGKIMEQAPVNALYKDAKHPYTEGLIESIPDIDQKKPKNNRLKTISGMVPNLHRLPKGCKFQTRCDYAMKKCELAEPELIEIAENHSVRCWLYD